MNNGKNSMRITPRHIILFLPALALAFLLILWGGLARWNGGMQGETDVMRRQLQDVRLAKPALQAMQAGRNARLATADPQKKQQGVLYAVMEDTLRASGLGNTVRQLRPELRELDVHVEEQLSLNLTQLDRLQLARFLYETQKAMPEMTVDSLSIRRNNNGFMDVDAVFLIRRPK